MDSIVGTKRLNTPLLNKNTAFSLEERQKYALTGLLPSKIETLKEQLLRVKEAFEQAPTPLAKHIYLRALQDTNETLFYRFLYENIEACMPIVYTPTVGLACQQFSHIYRKPRGLFLSYTERHHIPEILAHIKKTHDVRAIVMTDGERILGLGDQGLGGMGIPIGKLSLYTLCGGIHPAYTLPILLDVGTNNLEKMDDKDYLGWKHARLTGEKYNSFVDECVQNIKHFFPNVLLQFEDFAQQHANELLDIYKDQLCCFNDDIQGTASVAAGTLIAAIKKTGQKLEEQKIVLFGAGSAGCGIASLLIEILIRHGIKEKVAKEQIFMIDRGGLLHDELPNLLPFQKPFAQSARVLEKRFNIKQSINLVNVIEVLKPQTLLGVSGQPNQFTQNIIEEMAKYCSHPIIFPLSNPNDRCEANPQDLLNWTKGQAIVATGSPYPRPSYNNQPYQITQCNNSYIFPGMGLAVLAGELSRVTPSMFVVAAIELSKKCPTTKAVTHNLLPKLSSIRDISLEIATAVILEGIEKGVCKLKPNQKDIQQRVKDFMWIPDYE
jgi:malate dehydrogenase (oxaloacetate-decarboxylating)